MSETQSQIDLLIFYLKNEGRIDGKTKKRLGYIRIADVDKRKTIEKVEVSDVSETFASLKRKLEKVAKPCKRNDLPVSKQGFAIKWDNNLASQLEGLKCPVCQEINYYVKNYAYFLRHSARLAAVG